MSVLEQEIQAEKVLAGELEKYAGEWVAVRQHEVLAHAGSLEELLEQIKKEQAEVDGVFQVPESGFACFF